MSRQHIKARAQALKAKAAQRTEKALQLLETGKGVVAVAKELGIHRKTLWENLKKLNERQAAVNADTIEQMRSRHHSELRTMMDFVLKSEEMADSEVAGHFRAYAADIAKLMGLNAPERRVTANVDATSDPEKLQGYRRFVIETQLLTREQLEVVYQYARSLRPAPSPINLTLNAGETEGDGD
jgi:transposase-like protein